MNAFSSQSHPCPSEGASRRHESARMIRCPSGALAAPTRSSCTISRPAPQVGTPRATCGAHFVAAWNEASPARHSSPFSEMRLPLLITLHTNLEISLEHVALVLYAFRRPYMRLPLLTMIDRYTYTNLQIISIMRHLFYMALAHTHTHTQVLAAYGSPFARAA